MAVGGRVTQDVVVDEAAVLAFVSSPTGPVGQLLATIATRVTQSAKRHAPVSPHGSHGQPPGMLRSAIGWELGRDARGLYADISSPVLTSDGRNAPYGYFQSLRELRGAHGGRIRTTPHLQPALIEVIRSL